MSKYEGKPRTWVGLGEMCLRTDMKTKEVIKGEYFLQAFIPDDVDQAGLGEPNIIVRKGDYLNFRDITDKDLEKAPDWKKAVAQLVCWFSFPKK